MTHFHARSLVPPFALFLAGLIGCKRFPKNIDYSRASLINYFYEAQDPKDTSLLLSTSASLDQPDPIILYALGYTLLHAAIHWNVNAVNVPLNIITSSIADFKPLRDTKLMGCIKELSLTIVGREFLKIEEFPASLLHSVQLLKIELQVDNVITEPEEELFYRTLK